MTEAQETTGQAIKRLRQEQNLTLDKLAKRSGLSESYLWRIEGGERTPSQEARMKIAQALGVDPTQIAESGGGNGRTDALDVATAVMNDPRLTQQQKNVVLSVYRELRGREMA